MKAKAKAIAVAVAGALTLSGAGFALIQTWEGRENVAYRDVGGVWTICYGSTGPHVQPGMRASNEACNQMLRSDVVRFERAVQRCSAPAVLNQNQYDALVAFTFNVGERAYCNSTMSRHVREGNFQAASAQFTRWSYVQGRYVQGLNNRRMAEKALFDRPVQ